MENVVQTEIYISTRKMLALSVLLELLIQQIETRPGYYIADIVDYTNLFVSSFEHSYEKVEVLRRNINTKKINLQLN